MALYTKLSRPQIEKIAARFGLPPPRKIRGVLEGTVNTFYKLGYPDRNYFLKIDEVGSLERLEGEIRVFHCLQKIGKQVWFEVPLPLKAESGKCFIPFKKKFALIFTEVSGRAVMRPKKFHLVQIGRALGRLHRATRNISLPPHRFHLGEQERIFRQISPRLEKKYPVVHKQIGLTLAWLKKNRPSRLPEGLIHADLFPENIHFRKNRLSGILDFESAGSGEFLFDLGAALHACCHPGKRFSISRCRALLQGYQEIRPLTAQEKKQAGYFLAYSAHRFLLTRLKDFALKEGKIATKTYRDFREYLRRFDEIPVFTRILLNSRSSLP